MKTARTFILAACSMGLAFLSLPAWAAPQYCGGTVLLSWVNTDGAVLILSSWRGDHTQVCNIRSVWKGVQPDVCVSWVAKLDAATTMNKPVAIHYGDAPPCNSLPLYVDSPAPVYIMLYNN